MKKHSLLLMVVVCLLAASFALQAQQVCDKYGVLNINGGEYIFQNNVWGASTAQCVTVNGLGYTVTSSAHNQNSVAAYPSFYKGCHWGSCTTNSGMPILVSNVKDANFTWTIVNGSASGAWNAAPEAWFSPSTDTTDGYNGGAELMIWFNYQGMQPAGSQVGTATIAGMSWEVWYSNIGWNYIAYRRTGLSSATLNLLDFINDSVNRGYIQRSWYLHAMEAGFEIMSGGTGLSCSNFSFAVNKGTTTPTPTPTRTPTPTPTPTQGKKGDANNNGSVDITDCLVIAQYAAGMPVSINTWAADVNCDGKVDINDALLLARFSAGIIGLPTCN